MLQARNVCTYLVCGSVWGNGDYQITSPYHLFFFFEIGPDLIKAKYHVRRTIQMILATTLAAHTDDAAYWEGRETKVCGNGSFWW